MKCSHTKGISIVEVVIGVALTGLVVVFVSQTLALFFRASSETLTRTQALYLAEEGHEVLRYLRDADWGEIENLTNGTEYYLAVATTTLATTTTPEVIDDTFVRSFMLSEVRRDGTTKDIVASGGAVDSEARYVTFSVGWGHATVTLDALLTNLYDI